MERPITNLLFEIGRSKHGENDPQDHGQHVQWKKDGTVNTLGCPIDEEPGRLRIDLSSERSIESEGNDKARDKLDNNHQMTLKSHESFADADSSKEVDEACCTRSEEFLQII